MGPQCPQCNAVHEWTQHEIEAEILFPQIFFCQECNHMFLKDIDELVELQNKYRAYFIDYDCPRWDADLDQGQDKGPDLGPSKE